MRRALVIATIVCCAVTPAVAGPTTTVFPLSAPNLPMKIASAPEDLSQALANELKGSVAPMPLDDAAVVFGCDSEATTCLETVSKMYKSKRIVFGAITMIGESRLKVTLTRFDPGPDRQQRTFTLDGTVDEMAEELIKLSRSLFDGSRPKDDPDDPDDPPEDTDNPRRPDKPDELIEKPKGEISPTSYIILGGGIAMAATGGGFLISAIRIAGQVNGMNPKTSQEFEQLTQLEDVGLQRTVLGGALFGVGLVFVGWGVVRIVQERAQPASTSSESLSRRFTPVPIRGGAALVFTMELR